MTTPLSSIIPTAREIQFMQIHALACREYARENPTESRKAELRDIITNCEKQFTMLAKFRAAEPCLSDLSNDLLDDQIRKIEAIEYN